MSKSIKLKNGVYLESDSVLLDNDYNQTINDRFDGAIIKAFGDKTSVDVVLNNGWGMLLVITTYRMGIIQFAGTGNTPYVNNILGTLLPSFSWNGNTITISGLYNWEHYVFIGGKQITSITPH